MFTDLMNGLVIQAVPVTLGEDVRLKSSEVDVRLTGQLELVKSNTSSRTIGSSGEFVPGLTLNGSLSTTGGTYTLQFTSAVQRQFNVLPGGVVTFDGSSPETPLIDIRAQYTVRRQRDRDLNVIVNLTGRLPTPQIGFSSDNDYSLEQSDLLSYLIIGQPGFDFTNSGAAIGGFVSPTLSAFLANGSATCPSDRLSSRSSRSSARSTTPGMGTWPVSRTRSRPLCGAHRWTSACRYQ